MRVLVPGGAGFIGSAFCRTAAKNGWNVLNIDKLPYAANEASLAELYRASNYTFVRGDICDRGAVERLITEFHPTAIVHFAAESHVVVCGWRFTK